MGNSLPVTHGNLSSAAVAAVAITDDVAYDVAWLSQHSMEEFPRCIRYIQNASLYDDRNTMHYPTHAWTTS